MQPPQPRQPAVVQPPQVNPQTPAGPGAQKPPADHTAVPGNAQPSSNAAGQARSLLSALQSKNLPGVQSRLESARKMPGIKLDYAGLSRQLAAARSAFSSAQGALSGGKADAALQQAQAVKGQLAGLDQQITDAMKSAGAGDSGDQRQGNPRQR